MFEATSFMGRAVAQASMTDLIPWILCRAKAAEFTYLVTPNVDHVVRLSGLGDCELKRSYFSASLSVNDSRVLRALAFFVGKRITVTPGADIVEHFLESEGASSIAIAVVGPDQKCMANLASRFPKLDLLHIAMPYLAYTEPAFDAYVDEAAKLQWDVILICLGFPKQEVFAYRLKQRLAHGGVGLCVGASLDFLTGREARAPFLIRRFCLEWLFRMCQSPRKLFWRYCNGGPQLLFYFTMLEIAPMISGLVKLIDVQRLAGGKRE